MNDETPTTDSPLGRVLPETLRYWQAPKGPKAKTIKANAVINCGWGRLIFGHTFSDNRKLAEVIAKEEPSRRDMAFYIRDPHVVLSYAPHAVFLDPSHTYRIWFDQYQTTEPHNGIRIRRVSTLEDALAMNCLFQSRSMVQADVDVVLDARNSRTIHFLIAEDVGSGRALGAVLGVDHKYAFNDPENGASLWSLAVDPQCPLPGVGEALTRFLIEFFIGRGRSFMDLSVMHNNQNAIAMYEKLNFTRVPVFCLKNKNSINEPLFMAPDPSLGALNPYAQIIINEARRRGIAVDIIDAQNGFFSLGFGGRTVHCRESLTDLTSAVAMSRCDDKEVTYRLLARHKIRTPDQILAGADTDNEAFLDKYGSVVVKPRRGEQGKGVAVDLRTSEEMQASLMAAKRICDDVLIEQCVTGVDLRVVVIDYKVVAAAIRKPPEIIGNGQHTIQELIRKQSRRRMAATGGESRIPLDEETKRCISKAGWSLEDILPEGEHLVVRKTANLHTGGTIHDVTSELHEDLRKVSEDIARILEIPVVGLDFIVEDPARPGYHFIEANERPGLANHEPQPTAERFVDLLFPQTVARTETLEVGK